jgi:hypothetical protein
LVVVLEIQRDPETVKVTSEQEWYCFETETGFMRHLLFQVVFRLTEGGDDPVSKVITENTLFWEQNKAIAIPRRPNSSNQTNFSSRKLTLKVYLFQAEFSSAHHLPPIARIHYQNARINLPLLT